MHVPTDFSRVAALAALCALLANAPTATGADSRSPQELLKNYPNRLADIPAEWVTGNPIHLRVAFNLRHAPNSPQANEFLRTLARTITGLPYGVELTVERVIVPAKFAYVASMRFRNWETYRAYESSEGFLTFYRGTWKAAVTETDERVSVLDPLATTAR